MVNKGIIQGSKEQAQPVVVGKTTVYVHTNIERHVDEEHGEYYTYNEIQYSKDEYLELLQAIVSANSTNINDIETGLEEAYEQGLSNSDSITELETALEEVYEMIIS